LEFIEKQIVANGKMAPILKKKSQRNMSRHIEWRDYTHPRWISRNDRDEKSAELVAADSTVSPS
jgi:hypothetical protein